MLGNSTITCVEGGIWRYVDENFKCEPVDCKTPVKLVNGYMTGDEFHFGKRVFYFCKTGNSNCKRVTFISQNLRKLYLVVSRKLSVRTINIQLNEFVPRFRIPTRTPSKLPVMRSIRCMDGTATKMHRFFLQELAQQR